MNLNAARLVVAALNKAWPSVDPNGRTFEQATKDALARAYARTWPAGSALVYADVRAFGISTGIYYDVLRSREKDPYSVRWSDALGRTLKIIADRSGYKGETAQDLQKNAKGTGNIEIIIAIVIGALALLVMGAVVIWWITKVTQVADNELSRRAEERELVRTHAQAQQIVDNHLERERQVGHEIPWTEVELKALADLEMVQKMVLDGWKPTPPGEPPAAEIGLGIVAMVAVAGALWYFFVRKKAA